MASGIRLAKQCGLTTTDVAILWDTLPSDLHSHHPPNQNRSFEDETVLCGVQVQQQQSLRRPHLQIRVTLQAPLL